MDTNDSEKPMTGQSVQQVHLTIINPNKGNPEKSEKNESNIKKQEFYTIKDVENPVSEVESANEETNVEQKIEKPLGIDSEYDPTIDERLPETVTLLTTPDGGKVYLIGTAHFSKESQNDVSTIIRAVQPNIVTVELCQSRVHVLQLDEETVLREAKNLNFQKIRSMVAQTGVHNGLLYVLLLNLSAHLTQQLGMAPGGEFRRAFLEAKKVPNCLVHLGDRPINITIQRILNALSWWQRITLFWNLLTSRSPISKEDVERCKRRDMLEEILAKISVEFPSLSEVLVRERDRYLAYSLQLAAQPILTHYGLVPARVVGVVGIGHQQGIIDNWGKVTKAHIATISSIPPKSLSSKILKVTIRASLIGAIIYGGYKIIPLPSLSTLENLKSSIEGLIKVSVKA